MSVLLAELAVVCLHSIFVLFRVKVILEHLDTRNLCFAKLTKVGVLLVCLVVRDVVLLNEFVPIVMAEFKILPLFPLLFVSLGFL